MASVNLKKLKTATEVKAMLMHCDKKERLKHEHSNTDIDKSKTDQNIDLVNLSYKQVCERYDNRIKELDEKSNTNKRKDRVTCFGVSVPAPMGMDNKTSALFLKDCAVYFKEKYGVRNIISAVIHFDEIHEYISNGEIKESRPHLHLYVVPEIDGSLNGKKFSSKAELKKIQQDIDKLCREKYHIAFISNIKDKNYKSVEELKQLSNASILEQQNKLDRIKQETDEFLRETNKDINDCIEKKERKFLLKPTETVYEVNDIDRLNNYLNQMDYAIKQGKKAEAIIKNEKQIRELHKKEIEELKYQITQRENVIKQAINQIKQAQAYEYAIKALNDEEVKETLIEAEYYMNYKGRIPWDVAKQAYGILKEIELLKDKAELLDKIMDKAQYNRELKQQLYDIGIKTYSRHQSRGMSR